MGLYSRVLSGRRDRSCVSDGYQSSVRLNVRVRKERLVVVRVANASPVSGSGY